MFRNLLNRASRPDNAAVRWLYILGIATVIAVVLFVLVSLVLLLGITTGIDDDLGDIMRGQFTG